VQRADPWMRPAWAASLRQRIIIGEPLGQESDAAAPQALRDLMAERRNGGQTTVASDKKAKYGTRCGGTWTINPISALTGATTDLLLNEDWCAASLRHNAGKAKHKSCAIGSVDRRKPRRTGTCSRASSAVQDTRCCRKWTAGRAPVGAGRTGFGGARTRPAGAVPEAVHRCALPGSSRGCRHGKRRLT